MNFVFPKSLKIGVVALFFSALCSQASAEIVLELSKQVSPIPHKSVDTVGFYAGMPYEEFSAVAKKQAKKDLEYKKVHLTTKNQGNYVKIKEYISQARFTINDGDWLTVAFGTPVSGSQAVTIQRSVNFGDAVSAPPIEQVVKSLIDKYGPPSADNGDGKDADKSKLRVLYWMVTPKGSQPCKGGKFCTLTVSLDSNEVTAKKALDSGITVGIMANIYSLGGGKASSLLLVIDDYENKLLSENALGKFVDTEIANRSAKATPQMPKL